MKMEKVIPTLRVQDARRSEQFYCGTLGFTKDWEHQFGPDFPILMSVSFTGCTLFLSEHSGPGSTGSDNCDIYVRVDDVDAFHRQGSEQGLVFGKAPVDEPWGMREVAFQDPDNHRFTLGAEASGRGGA